MTIVITLSHTKQARHLNVQDQQKIHEVGDASPSEQKALLDKFCCLARNSLIANEIKSDSLQAFVNKLNQIIKANKDNQEIIFSFQGAGTEKNLSLREWVNITRLVKAANAFTPEKLKKERGNTIATAVLTPLTGAAAGAFFVWGVPALKDALITPTLSSLQSANSASLIAVACLLVTILTLAVTVTLITSACNYGSLSKQNALLTSHRNTHGDTRGALVRADDDVVQGVPVQQLKNEGPS